jgi:hypothetical protein
MLNTIPIKNKNNNNNHNNLIMHQPSEKTIAEETIIDEGIRKIEEKTFNDNFDQNNNNNKNIFSFDDNKENRDEEVKININGGDFGLGKNQNEEVRANFMNDDKKIMVTINEKSRKISIFDEKGNQLGYFTIEHIIKYLGDIYDTKQQFLKDIEPETFKQSKALIKKMIFKLNYNKKDKYADIILYDYTKSGFMGDVELLVKSNDLLFKYQAENMQTDLSKVDNHDRAKIEQNIRKFIFVLLNYTLRLISVISEKIKDNPDKKELKEQLLKYSININYKINLFVQEQLKIINNQNKVIKESLDMNLNIKKEIKNDLDKLIKKIQGNQPQQQSQPDQSQSIQPKSQSFTPSIIANKNTPSIIANKKPTVSTYSDV